MIKELVLFIAFFTLQASALPTLFETPRVPEKVVAIVPVQHGDLQPAKTFYSGYYGGYPNVGVGVNTHGGYGWRGQQGFGTGYGAGVGIGYGGLYGNGYLGGYGTDYGGVNSGGYGWRKGINRWAV